MSISFMKQPIQQTFYIDTTSLNAASVVKVLGIYIQQNLKWDTQVKEMLKKCNGRLFMLRTLKRFNLPLCDLITIYTGYVRPILEYCAPVFHSNLTQISLKFKGSAIPYFVKTLNNYYSGIRDATQ